MPKILFAVLAGVVLLFAVTLGLGQRDADGNVSEPEASRFGDLRELFVGDRQLEAEDLEGVSCFDGANRRFVVNPGAPCRVPVPGKVRRVVLDRQPGAGAVIRLASPETGTQRADQDDQQVRLDVLEEGSTLELTCIGPGQCRIGLA